MKARDLFQTEVKLEFVRRYCPPSNGWLVYVDIDPSEEGLTGGERKTPESRLSQKQMKAAAKKVRKSFRSLRVGCEGGRKQWCKAHSLPPIPEDRDILAFHRDRKICLIAEAEGASSGQPEQKLYKAAGQLVCAAGTEPHSEWKRILFLAVNGEKLAGCLKKMRALEKLRITGIVINKDGKHQLVFGSTWSETIS